MEVNYAGDESWGVCRGMHNLRSRGIWRASEGLGRLFDVIDRLVFNFLDILLVHVGEGKYCSISIEMYGSILSFFQNSIMTIVCT